MSAPRSGARRCGFASRPVLWATVACLATAAFSAPAVAQGLGRGGAFNVQRRVYYQNTVYEQTGLWYGGGGALRLGRLYVGVRTLMGDLTGEGGAENPDVSVRTTAATVQLALGPAVRLGVQAEARRFEADAGVTVWRLVGAAARLEPGLGVAGLRALAEVAVLPASSVTNGPTLKTALQATVGVSLSPGNGPLRLGVGYRFERYDIEATSGSPERLEQFRGLVVEAILRIGK